MKKNYGIVWDIYAQTGNGKMFFDWTRRSKWATLIILLTTFCNVNGQSPQWIDLVAGQWEIDAPEGLFGYLQEVNGCYSIPIFTIIIVGYLTKNVPALAAKVAIVLGVILYSISQFVLK